MASPGSAAARHAARLGRLVTLFEASGLFGGLVATIGEVDGLPVPGKFSGQDLAIHLLEDARKAAVQVVETGVAKIELDKRLTLTDQENKTYHPEAIIIASGASLRKLGVPGEEEFVGRGVSRCATCDGGFFRGQDVVVVGGGDGAVQEALVLAKTSRRVIMVCRSPLQGEARLYREARRTGERQFRLGQRGQRDSRRRRGFRRSPAQCEGRHELGHRMRGSVSVHRRDAEHRIRSGIVAYGDGTHQDEPGLRNLRPSRVRGRRGSRGLWWKSRSGHGGRRWGGRGCGSTAVTLNGRSLRWRRNPAAMGSMKSFGRRGERKQALRPLAKRLDTLNGKTIAQLWDYLFAGDEVFAALEEKLRAQYPDVKFVSWREFGSTHAVNEKELLASLPQRFKELGVDAAISSMAC